MKEPKGIAALANATLNAAHQDMLEHARRHCGGPAPWVHRKLAELHEVLALGEMSERYEVVAVDARQALRIMVQMRAPVPCLPDPRGELHVEPEVCLGITYPEAALTLPQPGTSFVQILAPRAVFHPNCGQPTQAFCLGPTMMAGLRLRELIILTYGGLTLQTAGFGERGNGVMNGDAALWWIANRARMPLTREPFIAPTAGGAL